MAASKEDEQSKLNLKKSLTELIEYVKNIDDNQAKTEVVNVMLQVFKSCCRNFVLHSQEFIDTSVKMSAFLFQFFDENMKLLERKIKLSTDGCQFYSYVTGVVNVNKTIISCFKEYVDHLNSLHELCVKDISCTPTNIIIVFTTAYQYFQNIEEIGEDYLSDAVKNDLKSLYESCYNLQCSLFKLVDNNIRLKMLYKEDQTIVYEILEKMFNARNVLPAKDPRLLADYWKCFIRLTGVYSEYVRSKIDVSAIIVFFCTKIEDDLKLLYDPEYQWKREFYKCETKKFISHSLKVNCFYVRIIIKICELYPDDLNDSLPCLCNLIFLLHRYSESCLKIVPIVSEDNIFDIDNFLTTGVDCLVKVLIEEPGFIKGFSQLLKHRSDDPGIQNHVASLLSLMTLMRVILSSPKDVLYEWLPHELDSSSILFTAFYIVSKSELAFCSNVKIPIMRRGVQTQVCLYDAMIVSLSTFTVSAIYDTVRLLQLEGFLLKFVFRSSKIMTTMFFCDLWCNVARYGSPYLRHKHILHLSKVIQSQVPDRIYDELTVFLCSLLRRIFSFLSYSQKLMALRDMFEDNPQDPTEENPKNYSSQEVFLMYTLCDQLPPHFIKLEIIQPIVITALSMTKDRLSSQGDTNYITYLVCALKFIAKFHVHQKEDTRLNNEISELIMLLWAQNFSDVEEVLIALCYLCSRRAHILNESQLTTVLEEMIKIVGKNVAAIKLFVLDFLKYICIKVFGDSQLREKIVTMTGFLFKVLLEDKNPFIRQYCLDTFVYVSHLTSYEQIITIAAPGDSTVNTAVTNYIQDNVQPLTSQSVTFLSFIEQLIGNKPNVINEIYYNSPFSPRNNTPDEYAENALVPKKKYKLNDNNVIDNLLERARKSLDTLVAYFADYQPSESQQIKLRNILKTVETLHNVQNIK